MQAMCYHGHSPFKEDSMFKQFALAAMVTATLAVSGCSSSPVSQTTIANGDYGAYPDNYQETVKEYFQRNLKDPLSAQYRFGTPYKGYLRDAPIAGGNPNVFGYVVECGVNAKNSYGGYTGEKYYRMFVKDNAATPITPNQWFDERWYK